MSSSASSKSKKFNFVSLLRKLNNTLETFNGLIDEEDHEPEILYSIDKEEKFNKMTRIQKREVLEEVNDVELAYDELKDSFQNFCDALEIVKPYFIDEEEQEESVDDDEMAEYFKQKQRRIEDTDYD